MIDSSIVQEIFGQIDKISAKGCRVGESLFAGRYTLANSSEKPAKIALEEARKSVIIGRGFPPRKLALKKGLWVLGLGTAGPA